MNDKNKFFFQDFSFSNFNLADLKEIWEYTLEMNKCFKKQTRIKKLKKLKDIVDETN